MIDNVHIFTTEQEMKAIAFDLLTGKGAHAIEEAYALADLIKHICKEDQERNEKAESFKSLLDDVEPFASVDPEE